MTLRQKKLEIQEQEEDQKGKEVPKKIRLGFLACKSLLVAWNATNVLYLHNLDSEESIYSGNAPFGLH